MRIKKYIFIILGLISLSLGIIGVFIPVLPTTPFLLLSSFLFLRSSEKLYNWLMSHKVLGEYIYNYMEHRAVKKSAKISAIIFLWLSMTISIILVGSTHVRLFLAFIGVAVTLHIATLRSLNIDDSKNLYKNAQRRK